MKTANRTILVAGTGTFTAALTETVWALVRQKKAKASLKESLVALTAAQKSLIDSSVVKETENTGSVKA